MSAPRPQIRDDVVLREVEGEFVLYDPLEDRVSLLNHTAAVLLELCDGTRDTAQLVRELQRSFEGADGVEDDVVRALAEFSALGLLVP